jgi:hypothetical protein
MIQCYLLVPGCARSLRRDSETVRVRSTTQAMTIKTRHHLTSIRYAITVELDQASPTLPSATHYRWTTWALSASSRSGTSHASAQRVRVTANAR